MIPIEKKLQEIVSYYDCNRNVGHTKILTDGIDYQLTEDPDKRCIFMRLNHNMTYKNNRVLVISHNKIEDLRGRALPLIIDHAAMCLLFKAAIERIEELNGIIYSKGLVKTKE